MTRPVILILVGLLLTGCKCQPPTSDPFFGRTTIPPPPTGSSTGQTVAPLYQAPPLVQASPQSPSSMAPPSVQMPGPALSAATPAGAPERLSAGNCTICRDSTAHVHDAGPCAGGAFGAGHIAGWHGPPVHSAGRNVQLSRNFHPGFGAPCAHATRNGRLAAVDGRCIRKPHSWPPSDDPRTPRPGRRHGGRHGGAAGLKSVRPDHPAAMSKTMLPAGLLDITDLPESRRNEHRRSTNSSRPAHRLGRPLPPSAV